VKERDNQGYLNLQEVIIKIVKEIDKESEVDKVRNKSREKEDNGADCKR